MDPEKLNYFVKFQNKGSVVKLTVCVSLLHVSPPLSLPISCLSKTVLLINDKPKKITKNFQNYH